MDKLEKANKLFHKGKYDKSLAIYEKSLTKLFKQYPQELVQYKFVSHKKGKKQG